ncbi:hypothetical protein, partial [Streptomyces antibioticus]|uniref:hypothetical protein n=1 Tax=Streptomyces antibioticus TaxID=1890 RepID=UPI0036D7E195
GGLCPRQAGGIKKRIAQAQFEFPRKRGNKIPQAEFEKNYNSREREFKPPDANSDPRLRGSDALCKRECIKAVAKRITRGSV